MILSVNLTAKTFASLAENKILLPEKEVLVQFSSTVYKLGTLIVTVRNGNDCKRYKTIGEPINITPLCQKAGAIEMHIEQVIRFETVKSWTTEQLILVETDHGFEAIPEIQVIKNDLKAFKQSVTNELNTVKSALRELAALVKENEKL